MPEIGEIARTVHYLRKHLVGRTISSCAAHPDDIVYGKVGCSADAFQKAVTGRKVTGADQQGKYFYMTFDKPPHAVMHFGMTGWFKFSCEETGYYRDPSKKEEEWPPRFVKFLLRCEKEGDRDAVEAAFVDARRLARIRLVDCNADKIREESPLKENGPDPVRDKDVVTVDWLKELLGRKRVPVKALILDQANLSGVGNWVADEILYQARVHPEQYSNTFDDDQIKRLHDSLIGVCTTAVETLADSTQFPEDWLMKYRWDKGKKDSNVLPNGQKIVHLKVGGRTSAIVPSVQKKTAAVAGDVDDGDDTPAKGRKRGTKAKAEGEDDEAEAEAYTENEEKPASKKARASKAKSEAAAKKPSRAKKSPANGVKDENDGDDEQADGGADDAEEADEDVKPAKKSAKGKKAPPKKATPTPATSGSRRSTRTRS